MYSEIVNKCSADSHSLDTQMDMIIQRVQGLEIIFMIRGLIYNRKINSCADSLLN